MWLVKILRSRIGERIKKGHPFFMSTQSRIGILLITLKFKEKFKSF